MAFHHPSIAHRVRRSRFVATVAVLIAVVPSAVVAQPLPATGGVAGQITSDSARSREPRFATPSALAKDAQKLARHVGLWASAGGGRGSAGLSCPACRDAAAPAFTAHFAIGGQPHERFHVGVEAWAWLDVIGDGLDRTARGYQVIARHYPVARKQFFLVGGAGTSRFSVDDGDVRFDASSPALSLGAGWDVPFRGVVLSPSVQFMASVGGELKSKETGNSVADNARLGLWRSTLSVTWF